MSKGKAMSFSENSEKLNKTILVFKSGENFNHVLPSILQLLSIVRNKTLTLIEREDDTRS
jgi:hypothetical protein